MRVGRGGEGWRLAVWNWPLERGSVMDGSLPFGGGVDGIASRHGFQGANRLNVRGFRGEEKTGDAPREVSSSKRSHRNLEEVRGCQFHFHFPND